MRDERVYHEFANWKLENNDLLKYLVENNSDLIIRFKHVLDVVEYLYDKLIDDINYSDDEDNIFETGFYYIEDQLNEIIKLLKSNYNNNIKELEQRAKDVNLLLSTIEFQNELLGVESFDDNDMNKLVYFEETVLKSLAKKEAVPESLYEEIDKEALKIFNKMNMDYYPVNDIFLEIADELGIV